MGQMRARASRGPTSPPDFARRTYRSDATVPAAALRCRSGQKFPESFRRVSERARLAPDTHGTRGRSRGRKGLTTFPRASASPVLRSSAAGRFAAKPPPLCSARAPLRSLRSPRRKECERRVAAPGRTGVAWAGVRRFRRRVAARVDGRRRGRLHIVRILALSGSGLSGTRLSGRRPSGTTCRAAPSHLTFCGDS